MSSVKKSLKHVLDSKVQIFLHVAQFGKGMLIRDGRCKVPMSSVLVARHSYFEAFFKSPSGCLRCSVGSNNNHWNALLACCYFFQSKLYPRLSIIFVSNNPED